MDFLISFFETLGLDYTFFIQLALAAALYAAASRYFFQPYMDAEKKREAMTHGRFKDMRLLEEKTTLLKQRYKEKAQEAYAAFQKDFLKIKKAAEDNFKIQWERLQKRHQEELAKELQKLQAAGKKEAEILMHSAPMIANDLLKKLTEEER